MYSSKITVIEVNESIDSVYDSYEEYEQHTVKLQQRGYCQIGFTTNGINNKVSLVIQEKIGKRLFQGL